MGDDLILTRLVRGLTFSDHGPFWEQGFDAVLVIEAAQIQEHAAGHYHLTTDTVDRTYSPGWVPGGSRGRGPDPGSSRAGSWTASDSMTAPWITSEDILVQDPISVDLAKVQTGEEVEVQVGFTNRGGTFDGTWSDRALHRGSDGAGLRVLGTESRTQPVPAGGGSR